MAVDERARLQLVQRLEKTLGPDAAATLMAMVSPGRCDHLATSAEVEDLGAGLRSDLEGQIAALREDLHGAIDASEERRSVRLESAKNELLATFRGELNEAITRQTRTLVISLAGTVVALGGTAIGLAGIG